MLQNNKVRLRAISRDDLPALARYNNDLEVELAGAVIAMAASAGAAHGRIRNEVESGRRDGNEGSVEFAIEGNGQFIGICALFNVNSTARTCELGISIGDKTAWGKDTAVPPSPSCLNTRLPTTTCTKFGYRFMAATNGPCAPTEPVALWRKVGSENRCGATAVTMTWYTWAFCGMNGSSGHNLAALPISQTHAILSSSYRMCPIVGQQCARRTML